MANADHPRMRRAIACLAALAAVLALILLWEGLGKVALPGCGPRSGCDEVAASRWARWGPIPVAGPGAAVYLAILVLSLLVGRLTDARWNQAAWSWLVALGLTAGAAALWFIGLQLWVIKRVCPYCMADHAIGLILAVWIVRGDPSWLFAGNRVEPGGTRRRIAIGALPILSLAVMIGGQMWMRPATHVVIRADALPAPRPAIAVTPTPAADRTLLNAPGAGRTVSWVEGRVSLPLAGRPILGPTNAPYVVADLFDYTCPHCRELHRQLHQARERYGAQLAVLPVMIPLAGSCNPLVLQTQDSHINACLYARYALAVWMAAPDKFEEFDRWLFEPEQPPPIYEARPFAERLVGAEAFQKALSDPLPDEIIRANMVLFEKLSTQQIPLLLMSKSILVGDPKSLDALFQTLEQELGIRPLTKSTAVVGGAGEKP